MSDEQCFCRCPIAVLPPLDPCLDPALDSLPDPSSNFCRDAFKTLTWIRSLGSVPGLVPFATLNASLLGMPMDSYPFRP